MIRRAVVADRLPAIRMARDFHAASGAPFGFSAAHAEAVFRMAMSAPNMLALVLDVEGPHGVLIAEAADHPFGDFRIARETIWWVDPGHRGRGTLAMLDAYEDWAREQNCTLVHMACLGTDPVLARLYRRRGYAPAETHFLKVL